MLLTETPQETISKTKNKTVFLKIEFEIIPLKLEYFIAKRLITAKDHKSSISAPIIKIAITAIALGMIMMIVSIATGRGLQQKIRQKVSAFNGHIVISGYNDNNSDVSTTPISIYQNFYPKFKTVDGITHVQAIASKDFGIQPGFYVDFAIQNQSGANVITLAAVAGTILGGAITVPVSDMSWCRLTVLNPTVGSESVRIDLLG
jgi:hypothetical protein